MFERWIANPTEGDIANSYRAAEEEMNNILRMAVYPKAKREAIKEELRKKFGTHSLGVSNEFEVRIGS